MLDSIVQILMKSMSLLNNQCISPENLNDLESLASSRDIESLSSSPDSICEFLLKQYKFVLLNEEAEADAIPARLKICVCFLLNRNERLFIKVPRAEVAEASEPMDQFTFKLDSVYIHRKLFSHKVKAMEEEKSQQSVSPSTSLIACGIESSNQFDYDNTINSSGAFTEQTILASEFNADTVFQLLHIRPPYTAEQIIQVESLKSPFVSESNRRLDSSVCSFCLRPEESNPLSRHDNFLTCFDCGSKAHSYCLKYSANLVENINVHKVKWQCYECKRCSVCLNTSDNMLLCDKCDRGYHKECCKPVLSKRPKGQFICHVCKEIYFKDEKLLINNERKTPKAKAIKSVENLVGEDSLNSTMVPVSSATKAPKSSKKRKLSTNSTNSSTTSTANTDANNQTKPKPGNFFNCFFGKVEIF